MSQNVARRAYSAEALLALRRSASDEPAMAIENKAGEPAIKDSTQDHVYRGTRSLADRSTCSLGAPDTLRPPIDTHLFAPPVLGEIDPNNQTVRTGSRFQPSPTGSIKKKKAEQILKQHGSPPGLRVTAGGRIVPSDHSPLCSPRYGYSAISKNGGLIRFAPGYPPPPNAFLNLATSLPNGFVAQDPSGRLCQMVDGRFLPITEANGIPQLYITAPNLSNISSGKSDPISERSASHSPTRTTNARVVPVHASSGLSFSAQILALERQYTKLETERRDLDKAEVLQRTAMTGKAYNQLIQKRRELVSRLNDIRISIKGLQDAKSAADAPMPPPTAPSPHLLNPMQRFVGAPIIQSLPYGAWPYDNNIPEPYGMPPFAAMSGPPELNAMPPHSFYAGAPAPYMPFPPFFAPGQDAMMPGMFPHTTLDNHSSPRQQEQAARPQSGPSPSSIYVYRDQDTNAASSEKQNSSTSAGSANVGMQKKADVVSTGPKSVLNPMSPSYEPGTSNSATATPDRKFAYSNNNARRDSAAPGVALAEAVRAHNAWAGSSSDASQPIAAREDQEHAAHSSDSSYATADFFPQNPRDHSMNKQAYPVTQKASTEEIRGSSVPPSDEPPVTPEKERHNPNWNPTIPDQAFRTEMSPREQTYMARSQDGATADVLGSMEDPIPNRSELNISPKNRPDFLQTHKSVSEMATMGSPGPSPPAHAVRPASYDPSAPSLVDLTTKPIEYIQGFRAGLERSQIGPDKGVVFLDGYCAGLLKSGQLREAMSDTMHIIKSVETSFMGPSDAPSSASSVAKRIERRSEVCPPPPLHLARPPLELNTQSLDTFKEAVNAPHNENALLSPDANGPTVQAVPGNLGVWSKNREQSVSADGALKQIRLGENVFPERTSSMVSRQLENRSSNSAGNKPVVNNTPKPGEANYPASQNGAPDGTRTVSSQSQPASASQSSYLHRAYPGHRVLSSPALDWKAATSIAQVAGMAQGYFAQYDGTTSKTTGTETSTPLRVPLPVSPKSAKFREATMSENDQPVSPSSPNASPSKKSVSPAKAKFAQIAGKAGIKVRSERPASKEENTLDGPEQMSPQERRRWRDVWKKRNTAVE